MSDCPYVYHMGAGALGGHKGESDPLELELQAVVSCLMWVLRTELWFWIFPMSRIQQSMSCLML